MRLSNWQNKILILLVLGVLSTSCDFLKVKEQSEIENQSLSDPIARVHNNFLYPEDLEGLVAVGISVEDSANRVERYVNSWIRKQLIIDEAMSKMEFDEAALQRKILEYRYSLIGYEYQSYFVNQNLNKVVSEQDVFEYYDAHKDNFPLKQNVFRGKFIKVPLQAPKINTAKRLIRSNKEADEEELRSYCLTYATLYNLEDSTWVNYDELIQSTSFAEDPNKMDRLKNRTYLELNDQESLYLIKVLEYKTLNEIAPVEIVRDQIRNIIINKRKVELANNLEEDVYEKAKNAGDFEIYN